METEKNYLAATEVINWHDSNVLRQAKSLAANDIDLCIIAKRCFEWVRDEIKHSSDYKLNPVTCNASEVLTVGTGYCYAKSHLLTALLRANGIPAGFCYQRLSIDGVGPPFCLHGLNAVQLPGVGWYRIDSRGNRADIRAEFTPPVERLAFPIQFDGEYNLPEIYSQPLPQVLEVLRCHSTWDGVLANLPDVE